MPRSTLRPYPGRTPWGMSSTITLFREPSMTSNQSVIKVSFTYIVCKPRPWQCIQGFTGHRTQSAQWHQTPEEGPLLGTILKHAPNHSTKPRALTHEPLGTIGRALGVKGAAPRAYVGVHLCITRLRRHAGAADMAASPACGIISASRPPQGCPRGPVILGLKYQELTNG